MKVSGRVWLALLVLAVLFDGGIRYAFFSAVGYVLFAAIVLLMPFAAWAFIKVIILGRSE